MIFVKKKIEIVQNYLDKESEEGNSLSIINPKASSFLGFFTL